MNYRVLFFIIGISVFLMGVILFYVVAGGAKMTQEKVLRGQENNTLLNPVITKGIYGVGIPMFNTVQHACEAPFREEVYISLILQYGLEPDICAFFVNDLLVYTEHRLEADCVGECPYGEFTRTIPLGEFDVRDSHVVKTCCDDICIERPLPAQCSS